MQSMSSLSFRAAAVACASAFALGAVPAQAQGTWEPAKTVEFIVPAGTGGGADQMARFIQGLIQKHNLMKQPMVVINKSGGAGGQPDRGSRAMAGKRAAAALRV